MAKENKLKMTFKQMKNFNHIWNEMVRFQPSLAETKLGYAFKRFFTKNIEPIFEEYNGHIAMVRIENALEHKDTKAVLTKDDVRTGGRGFEYSKDGLKAVIKAEIDLAKEWDPKEYEVEPYISKDVPKKVLSEEQVEAFTGFII
jgi:hypothetical protein